MASQEKIIVMEDHGQAWDVWRRYNIKNATLVHLDAHIDFVFYPVKPAIQAFQTARDMADLKRQLERGLLFEKYGKDLESQANLANYIYPAMREGIVQDFEWIIPGDKRKFKSSLKSLRRLLTRLQSQDPFNPSAENSPALRPGREVPSSGGNQGAPGFSPGGSTNEKFVCEKEIRAKLYGRDVSINDLFSAPNRRKQVLLDIDVDFFLFDSAQAALSGAPDVNRKPWILPGRFTALVNSKFPRRLITTIAYSVNGGYTPIEYKFFGDEIALRLKGNPAVKNLESIFALRNQALDAYFRGHGEKALDLFKRGLSLLKEDIRLEKDFKAKFCAHLSWWIFKILWSQKKKEAAKEYYQRAVCLDPTLRAKDNNLGPAFLKKGKWKAAFQEFEKIVYCDPAETNALQGLGDVLFRQKKYGPARDWYEKAFRHNSSGKKNLLGLAEAYFFLEDFRGAKRILAKLLKEDPLNGDARRIHAQISAHHGQWLRALNMYKEAVIFGPDREEMYPDIFRILKIEKNEGLSKFFGQRYEALKRQKAAA